VTTPARVEVLILDDWRLAVLTATERRDLLEILEDRHGRGSSIVTSQLPVTTGTRSSATPHLQMPFLIHRFKTPIASPSQAIASDDAERS